MHSSKEAFTCTKSKHPTWNFSQFCQVRCQCWQKESTMLKYFFLISRSKITHIASFLFSDNCVSAAQTAKISLLIRTAASLDNHLVLNARCNCRPFVLVIVWYIARQADRNDETVKHFHNCSVFFCKTFSQFCTPYCTNLRQYSKRPKRGGAHDNAQIPNLQLQPSVAVAMCRKTCFPQFVFLQYKVKPYLGFQNLGCHCKILGCHFDIQIRLKKALIQCKNTGNYIPIGFQVFLLQVQDFSKSLFVSKQWHINCLIMIAYKDSLHKFTVF